MTISDKNISIRINKYLKKIVSKDEESLASRVYTELSAREISPASLRLHGDVYEVFSLSEKENNLIISEASGSGKTTVLKWLNFRYANEYLKGHYSSVPLYIDLIFYNKGDFSKHIEIKANEPDDPTRKLHFTGIYFYDYEEKKIYLPLPMDCVKKKNEKKNEVSILPYVNLDNIKTSCPTQYALKGNGNVENVAGGLITSDLFKKYLTNSERSFSFIKISDKISIEHKIGIGIDKNSGTSEEGKLYRTGMNRLNDLSLLIEFDNLDLPSSGFLKLGGEGRAVSYKIFSSEKFDMSFQIKDNYELFKLYLLTPAIFKNGWLPEWIDEKTLVGDYHGLKLKLVSASIGKTISIGGFDMKARKPKPMCKAVPAGSVYYFKLIEGEIQTAFKQLNQTPISDFYSKQGFGIAYIGVAKNA